MKLLATVLALFCFAVKLASAGQQSRGAEALWYYLLYRMDQEICDDVGKRVRFAFLFPIPPRDMSQQTVASLVIRIYGPSTDNALHTTSHSLLQSVYLRRMTFQAVELIHLGKAVTSMVSCGISQETTITGPRLLPRLLTLGSLRECSYSLSRDLIPLLSHPDPSLTFLFLAIIYKRRVTDKFNLSSAAEVKKITEWSGVNGNPGYESFNEERLLGGMNQPTYQANGRPARNYFQFDNIQGITSNRIKALVIMNPSRFLASSHALSYTARHSDIGEKHGRI
jgi:hypothetical protein